MVCKAMVTRLRLQGCGNKAIIAKLCSLHGSLSVDVFVVDDDVTSCPEVIATSCSGTFTQNTMQTL